MRTEELIKLMPTQFRRVSDTSSLYVGHHIPKIGYWSKAEGYVKLQSLKDDNINRSLACPIIAIVTRKMGNKDVILTITGKTSEFVETEERTQGDYTIYRKTYKPTEDIITGTLTIPRYTRPFGTFLITGLGRDVYEISSITDDVDIDVGKIEFYALASAGSKIIYWLGIHKLAEQLREILRPWIAPSKCNRCGGTGIEPTDGTNAVCEQCHGYKYDGYSAVKYVQRKLGMDVGLARDVLDWDNLTDADHDIIKKFINKAWTQKWWVTPTVKEIRRLIRHFYMITDAEIEIYERFHSQEPVWKLFLPLEPDTEAPFGQNTTDDRFLLKYIAETITPAGVSVFVGFFKYFEDFGDFDGLDDDGPIFPVLLDTSMESHYSLWGTPRWAFWNGWQEAVIDFENEVCGYLVCSGAYSCSGAYRQNVNDKFRHMCRFDGINSYFQVDLGTGETTGCVELWARPVNSDMRFSLLDEHNVEKAYIDYTVSQKGFFCGGTLLDLMCPDNSKHLRLCWAQTGDHVADWFFATDYRKQIVIDDNGTRRNDILYEIDMSSWAQFTSRANNKNYVRITQMIGGVETEINSQTYDASWNSGNQDHVAVLLTTTAQETTLYVYYGNVDLGDPNYTSNLTLTANAPAAGDYTVQQDDFYKTEVDKDLGATFNNFWTRVSGANVAIDSDRGLIELGAYPYVDKNGVVYQARHDPNETLTLIEGSIGGNTGPIFVVLKGEGVLHDAAGPNPLQDDAANDVKFERIHIFCDCQLIKIYNRIIIQDTISNIRKIRTESITTLNDYFSHQSYKHGVTHVVELLQARDISANWSTKKYICRLDPVSNDGIAVHFISEDLQRLENETLIFNDAAGRDYFQIYQDESGDNDQYSAGTEEIVYIIQCDDFTEADGVNDDDGDQPAHRKNTELLETITQTETSVEKNEDEFSYDLSINLDNKLTGTFRTNPGIRYFKFSNRSGGTGFIDAIGWGLPVYSATGATGAYTLMVGTYTVGDNFQTLYPDGWGINHDDFIDGEADIMERFFRMDKPIKL